jgi:hypothetical protein
MLKHRPLRCVGYVAVDGQGRPVRPLKDGGMVAAPPRIYTSKLRAEKACEREGLPRQAKRVYIGE